MPGFLNASAYVDAKCCGFCSRAGERAGERRRGQASPLHLRIAVYQRARTVSRGRVGTAIGTIGTVGTGDAVMEHTSTSRLGSRWPGRVRIRGTIGRLGQGFLWGWSAEQPGHGERVVLKG